MLKTSGTGTLVLTNALPLSILNRDKKGPGWEVTVGRTPTCVVGKGTRLALPLERSGGELNLVEGRSQTLSTPSSLVVRRKVCRGLTPDEIAQFAEASRSKTRTETAECERKSGDHKHLHCFCRTCASFETLEGFYIGGRAELVSLMITKSSGETAEEPSILSCYTISHFGSESDFVGIQLLNERGSFVEVYFLNWAEHHNSVIGFEKWAAKFGIRTNKFPMPALPTTRTH